MHVCVCVCIPDPVEKPALNVSSQQSNGTCNVTLTCKVQELSITSHCYKDNWDKIEEKTLGNSFLSVYISNSFIICNHSNPASWKNDTLKIEKLKEFCLSKGVSMHTYAHCPAYTHEYTYNLF